MIRRPPADQTPKKLSSKNCPGEIRTLAVQLAGKHLVGHTKIRRHHGTDFIGCRRGEGGASTGTAAVPDRCYVTQVDQLAQRDRAAS